MDFYSTLIKSEELFAHLSDPDWVVIDCRFDLFQPEWGLENYRLGSIPGAVYADVEKDLSGPKTGDTGRHPLPDPESFLSTMGSMGVSNQSQVVVYDTSSGSFAARLWWLLIYYGHPRVAVLDGGYTAWVQAGFPIMTGDQRRSPAHFTGFPNEEMVISSSEMLTLHSHEGYRVMDARSPERFRGEIELIDPIAGRIPNSLNRFHQDNLDQAGKLKEPEILLREFKLLLGDAPPENVIVYCGSGVTACHHLLALASAGVQGVKLYAGSWSEWILDPNRPLAKG